ncbi:Uncharacterized protein dnm_000890 [Desulfonema magnum]|uniref:Uncharacterized protein n=1 Tax=Desulfonema magnum TaxID=45655 RepID=A0A975BEW4_9BACT|nr:Uncharacterized protein dnm_000890 [Desulfonema magnum]
MIFALRRRLFPYYKHNYKLPGSENFFFGISAKDDFRIPETTVALTYECIYKTSEARAVCIRKCIS